MAAMTAAAVFRIRQWQWARGWGATRELYIPDEDKINETLLHLAENLRENSAGYTSATGRLYVEKGEDGELHMSIDLGRVDDFYSTEEATPLAS